MSEAEIIRLRKAPWCGPEGVPALILPSGSLAKIADSIERQQLDDALSLIDAAQALLSVKASKHELQFTARRLMESLVEVCAVAESALERLPDDA